MKTTRANTSIEIYVNCPYCNEFQDRFEELRECLTDGELWEENCDEEIVCEKCKKTFIVEAIDY